MEKKQNKAPLVRFPKFKDDWEYKRFEDFLIYTPRPKAKPKSDYLSIGLRSHFKGTFQKPDTDPNKNAMDTLYEIKENDFLVNITFAWEGALAIVPKADDGGFVSHRFPTYTFENEVDNLFFKYHFFKEKSKHQLGVVSPGGAGRNRVMNKTDFVKLKLPFPTLPEQQKIAHFFTTLDKKIDQLQEKKNALEQYKKGMMQKLFSQEIRFKDDNGKDYSEWEEKKLGEVCEKISSGNSKNSNDGEFDLYGSTGLIGKCDEPSHNGYFLLIARVGANAGQINRKDGEFGVSDNTLVVETKSDISFLYYLLLNFNLNRLIFGSGQPLITGGQLKGLKLYFPTLPEQTKIANFLSKIDDKINTVNEQIEQTKTYKKGLLQKMFV